MVACRRSVEGPALRYTKGTKGKQRGCNMFNFVTFWQQLIFLSGQVSQCSCPIHATAGTKLAEVIAAKKLDKNGLSCHCFILPCNAKASAKCKQSTTNESCHNAINTNIKDKTFVISVFKSESDDNSLDSDSDNIKIRNEEVWIILF